MIREIILAGHKGVLTVWYNKNIIEKERRRLLGWNGYMGGVKRPW